MMSLVNWNPKQSDLLSKLILILKISQDQTWNNLAEEFLMHWSQEIVKSTTNGPAILVSLKSSNEKTHAQMWGQSLSKLVGFPHVAALIKEPHQHESWSQRRKNRTQRQALKLRRIVDISVLKGKKIIFVDDVVTTGATLHASYRALGEPTDFECWSLCYRNPLSIAETVTKC
jgi:predicted amidophosphoribosyltransferase